MPGVESHVDLLVERERGEMTIATAYIVNRCRQWEILKIGTFDCAQKGAEVRKIT